MSRFLLAIALVLFLSSCGTPAPPATLPSGIPQAKLRVAVDTTYATNTDIWRAAELKCGSSSVGHLGFFHPNASGAWQKDRRLYGLRQSLVAPATVPDNMYSEHVLALDRPVYVHFNSALTSCAGVVELPLQAGKEYEFLLSVRGNSCIPRLFTLNAASRLTREEVTLAAPIEGPACRM
jgi:hypothetical protein